MVDCQHVQLHQNTAVYFPFNALNPGPLAIRIYQNNPETVCIVGHWRPDELQVKNTQKTINLKTCLSGAQE